MQQIRASELCDQHQVSPQNYSVYQYLIIPHYKNFKKISPKIKCFRMISYEIPTMKIYLMKMYGDQSGEFVCGY